MESSSSQQVVPCSCSVCSDRLSEGLANAVLRSPCGAPIKKGLDNRNIPESVKEAERPSLPDLLAFKGKVDRKIESTRGVVISIPGFDDDVVRRLKEAASSNLILIDGYDLVLILDGRLSLIDALQAKIERAAQEGVTYFPLSRLFQ